MKVREFWKIINTDKYAPLTLDSEKLEEIYWKQVFCHAPLYGTGIEGFWMNNDEFNFEKLNTILDKVKKPMSGINIPWIYLGTCGSRF